MLNKNIETFIACDAPYEEASVVLYGAPFDGTTSYRPGTRFGSAAARHESYGLETYSPYQNADLVDCAVFDSGDLELPFGDPARALAAIEDRAARIFDDGKIPFLLGGEHLVSLGAIRAAAKRYPGLAIVHFDAHADLRTDYLGSSDSHACVIRRAWELLGDDAVFQFGIRSGDRSEFEWGASRVRTTKFGFDGLEETLRALENRPVYLTVDLDVLDPSVFPGTGTPEPGGVTFDQLRCAATSVCRGARVVGLDAVELSPPYDPSGISVAATCKLVREMLIALL